MKWLSGRCRSAVSTALLLTAGAWATAQQPGTEKLDIYKGESSESSGITASAWGSGIVTPDPQVHIEGSAVLQGGDARNVSGRVVRVRQALRSRPVYRQ